MKKTFTSLLMFGTIILGQANTEATNIFRSSSENYSSSGSESLGTTYRDEGEKISVRSVLFVNQRMAAPQSSCTMRGMPHRYYGVHNFAYQEVKKGDITEATPLDNIPVKNMSTANDILEVVLSTVNDSVNDAKNLMGNQLLDQLGNQWTGTAEDLAQLLVDGVGDSIITIGSSARDLIEQIRKKAQEKFPPVIYDLLEQKLNSLKGKVDDKVSFFLEESSKKEGCCGLCARLTLHYYKLIKGEDSVLDIDL